MRRTLASMPLSDRDGAIALWCNIDDQILYIFDNVVSILSAIYRVVGNNASRRAV
jgi:hypothetical protein